MEEIALGVLPQGVESEDGSASSDDEEEQPPNDTSQSNGSHDLPLETLPRWDIVKDDGIRERCFRIQNHFIVKCQQKGAASSYSCALCTQTNSCETVCGDVKALVKHVWQDHGISELQDEPTIAEVTERERKSSRVEALESIVEDVPPTADHQRHIRRGEVYSESDEDAETQLEQDKGDSRESADPGAEADVPTESQHARGPSIADQFRRDPRDMHRDFDPRTDPRDISHEMQHRADALLREREPLMSHFAGPSPAHQDPGYRRATCIYRNKRGEQCVNIKEHHSKGHQDTRGRIIGEGPYEGENDIFPSSKAGPSNSTEFDAQTQCEKVQSEWVIETGSPHDERALDGRFIRPQPKVAVNRSESNLTEFASGQPKALSPDTSIEIPPGVIETSQSPHPAAVRGASDLPLDTSRLPSLSSAELAEFGRVTGELHLGQASLEASARAYDKDVLSRLNSNSVQNGSHEEGQDARIWPGMHQQAALAEPQARGYYFHQQEADILHPQLDPHLNPTLTPLLNQEERDSLAEFFNATIPSPPRRRTD
ncbi:hypothetical protein SLS60_001475 [Paraconiothyrium brasiliense]|uniref:Uncharacterized protein n=1 Tax=Paraconiothyrium brasiliense TaxID=300254 RepID=A0ABR3S9Y4_9PLEO